MSGYMHVLVQLGMGCLADQTHAVELSLSVPGADRCRVFFGRRQQLQRDLKNRIIGGSIARQGCEVMGKRVQQFHDELVARAMSRGKQDAEDDPRSDQPRCVLYSQSQLSPHNHWSVCCGLFTLQRFKHDLHARLSCQDHGPEITFLAIGATAFVESGAQDLETGLKNMILSRLASQFLREGQSDAFTAPELRRWTRPLQHGVNHC